MRLTIVLVIGAALALGVFASHLQRECVRYEVVPLAVPQRDAHLAALGFADPYVYSDTRCAEYGGWIQH